MMLLTKWLPIILIPEEFLISSVRFYVIDNRSPSKNTRFFASYTKEVLWSTKKYLSCLLPLASVASLRRALPVIIWMYLFMLITIPSFTKVRATWMRARMQSFPLHLIPPRKKPQRFILRGSHVFFRLYNITNCRCASTDKGGYFRVFPGISSTIYYFFGITACFSAFECHLRTVLSSA